MSSDPASADYYAILEVPKTANTDEIRRAYRRLALQWHPDKNPNNAVEAETKFKLISEAFSVLSDSSKRSSYDYSREQRANGYNPSFGRPFASPFGPSFHPFQSPHFSFMDAQSMFDSFFNDMHQENSPFGRLFQQSQRQSSGFPSRGLDPFGDTFSSSFSSFPSFPDRSSSFSSSSSSTTSSTGPDGVRITRNITRQTAGDGQVHTTTKITKQYPDGRVVTETNSNTESLPDSTAARPRLTSSTSSGNVSSSSAAASRSRIQPPSFNRSTSGNTEMEDEAVQRAILESLKTRG